MGSSHIGHEMCSGSGGSSTSRRAKKGEKAKQPQRGLGVAQLEKIRIQNQIMAAYNSGASFAHQDTRMQIPYAQPSYSPSSTHASTSHAALLPYRTDCFGGSTEQPVDIQYCGSHTSEAARQSFTGDSLLPYHVHRPTIAAQSFLSQNMDQVSDERVRREGQQYWMSSSGHESGTSNSQELDLELRL